MTARLRRFLVLTPLALGLGACAQPPQQQLSLEQAELYCSQNLSDNRTGVSAQPRVSVGIGSGGYHGGFVGIDFTPEARGSSSDPNMIYHDCVRRRSGKAPTRSLYEMPGWGGAGS